MNEIRILFTGVGRRVELIQAFRQAALVLGKDVKLYGADIAGTAPALSYCDYVRRVCGMKDPGYIEELLRLCHEDRIDLLVPTIDTDLLVLSENKARFEGIGTRVLISRPEMIGLCRDKNQTAVFFIRCGLLSPKPVKDWTKYSLGYPAFIKPKDGSSSIGAAKVTSETELEVQAQQLQDYIVQPYISGEEYTVDIFCDFVGNPISIVPRKRLQVRAGEVLKTQICMDEKIISECRQLCRSFLPCGPITVQLIREEISGQDYFIEINPRFGGGAPLSMKAGARSAENLIKLLSGELTEEPLAIADQAVYSRFDQSVCISDGTSIHINGVIFDLDDTLYSEKEYVRSGLMAVAEYLGDKEYAARMWDFFSMKKPPIDEILRELGREEEKDEVLKVYRHHMPYIQLYKGVAAMLQWLKDQGIKTGIITDGRPEGQRAKIHALGLNDLVDDIIITDELGGTQFRKPCDIAFRIMQMKWRIPPQSILYIGDNPSKDYQAPQQIDMKCLYFNNPDSIYSNGVIYRFDTVTSIEEVRNYLQTVIRG